MILGIDTGMATCGWALLDETRCAFVDLGVVITKRGGKKSLVTLDRARRCNVQAKVIAEKAPGCSTIIVERMSFPPGGVKSAVPIALSWGIVLGVVATMKPEPRLVTIAPQRWQREVLPNAGREVDYDELARSAAAHILARHPAVHASFSRIPDGQKSHAIDAAMIALCAALVPRSCETIAVPTRPD